MSSDCKECKGLQAITCAVLDNGFVRLSDTFRSAFPGVTYHSHSAKCRVLQLPLAALRVGRPESGTSEVYLMDYVPEVNYCHVLILINTFHLQKQSALSFTKDELKDLLKIAQECIRYATWRSSRLSATAAWKHFGFDNMRVQELTVFIKLWRRQDQFMKLLVT